MKIRELTLNEFNDFSSKHPLSNFHQTINYAHVKSDDGYENEMIGLIDDNDNIIAAALVLVKMIKNYLYAYVPEGYLIDYSDVNLLKTFTDLIIKYYKKEGISFIKINPSIVTSEIDIKTKNRKNIDNTVKNCLISCGYTKLMDNNYFESTLPRINAIKNLDNFSLDSISKNARNKVRKAIRKGLTFEKNNDAFDDLNRLVKNKVNKEKFHYKDYLNNYKDNIDLFLVSIDYKKYLINSQDIYDKEVKNNELLSNKVVLNPSEKNINKKLNSDKAITSYKEDIQISSNKINNYEKEYIAAALVVRHNDKATIIISGFDKKYSDLNANYFLYYSIMDYYKDDFKYLDLNGITLDFTKNNKYYGLNEFKLSFKPNIYEYIGEFDLIINKINYNYMLNFGLLAKEFNK